MQGRNQTRVCLKIRGCRKNGTHPFCSVRRTSVDLGYFQWSPLTDAQSCFSYWGCHTSYHLREYLLVSPQSSAPSLFLPHIWTWGPPLLLFERSARETALSASRPNSVPNTADSVDFRRNRPGCAGFLNNQPARYVRV
jgi:hypothetical protein